MNPMVRWIRKPTIPTEVIDKETRVKTKIRCVPLIATLLLAASISLSGCAATGRSAAPGSTIHTVETSIRQGIVQVDATSASLHELIKPDQADLQHAYNVYAANVAQMDTLATQLDTHSNRINALGKEYFSEWKKREDISADPQIQGRGAQGHAELAELYDLIPQANVGVGSALHAYMSYILETQMYLARHLTPKGIAAITPVARKGIKGGDDFKEALTHVLSAMEQVNAKVPRINEDTIPASVH